MKLKASAIEDDSLSIVLSLVLYLPELDTIVTNLLEILFRFIAPVISVIKKLLNDSFVIYST